MPRIEVVTCDVCGQPAKQNYPFEIVINANSN